MNLPDAVKSITYLKNNAAEVVRDAAESGRLLVVTQDGEAIAVVMVVAQSTEWRHALALLELRAQGEADIRSKHVVEHTEAFRRAKVSHCRVTAIPENRVWLAFWRRHPRSGNFRHQGPGPRQLRVSQQEA